MTTAPVKRDGKQQLQGSIRDLIQKQTTQFAMLMPAETVDRFKRIIFTTLNDHPELERCEPRSLLSVCMHAAQDGLYLDGREAAIVPFRIGGELKATYMPMVIGLRKKVRASGEISDWNCQVVFEGEPFDYAQGDRSYLHHKPALSGGSNRKIIGAYSVATFKDGTKSREWMTIDQIEEVRGKSKASSGPAWSDPVFYPEMCRKTVARRHSKQLPMASDIENIFRNEDDSREGGEGPVPPTPPAPSLTFERGADYSVADTLDDFASGSLATPDNTSAARNAVNDAQGGGVQDQGQFPPTAIDGSAAADNLDASIERARIAAEVVTAWQRGRADRAKGVSNKAIPGEFRSEKRLWQAWLDGYDNVAKPPGVQ